jgi:hypothetical protein
MLRSLKYIERYTVSASDGDIGDVVDFYLDDKHWTVRYLIVETGALFERRQVLISPVAFNRLERAPRRFHVNLTKEAVQSSPSVETDKPVSRQFDWDYFSYFGNSCCRGQSGLWGTVVHSNLLSATQSRNERAECSVKPNDIHLRSASEVRGYHVQAINGNVGLIGDFVVDDESWQIRYFVVDTGSWWVGRKVLISPHWATRISWGEGKVHLSLSRQSIRDSPTWKPTAGYEREYVANTR